MELVRRGVAIPKSLKDLCILDILASATRERPLTQEEVRGRLERNYGIVVDRKTVHRRIEALMECVDGIRIAKDEEPGADGEPPRVKTGLWLDNRLFEDEEILALIYLTVFSKHVSPRAKSEIVATLKSLSASKRIRDISPYVLTDENTEDDGNNYLFSNLVKLDEAISTRRMVRFRYLIYGADKRAILSGTVYTASPLGIGVHDENFYLLSYLNGIQKESPDRMIAHFQAMIDAAESSEAAVSSFNVGRMRELEVLDERRDDLSQLHATRLRGHVPGQDRFDVQEYLRENPDLRAGHSVHGEFHLTESARCTITDVIDRFGKSSVHISTEREESYRQPAIYRITVHTNVNGLREFALVNAADIEVIKPASLREELQEIFKKAADRG